MLNEQRHLAMAILLAILSIISVFLYGLFDFRLPLFFSIVPLIFMILINLAFRLCRFCDNLAERLLREDEKK